MNKGKEDFGFGVPFVNLMDVFGKTNIKNSKFDLVNAKDKELELYNLKKGDVLFIRSSVKREGVGEAAVVSEDLDQTVYSGFLIRFREFEGKELDLRFKRYLFSNPAFRNQLISYSTTSANTNINQDSLGELKVRVPVKEEQERIGNFLSSIDEKIEYSSDQIESTRQYKQAQLQQLFN